MRGSLRTQVGGVAGAVLGVVQDGVVSVHRKVSDGDTRVGYLFFPWDPTRTLSPTVHVLGHPGKL